jgi:xanthine dehydrogenase accessory factor
MVVRLDLVSRAASLSAAGHPFVWATVVRAQRPTSAKAGDSALVLADGEVSGFVGGACAESTVRAQALQVLSTGETRLLRISPDAAGDESGAPAEDGVVAVHNPCLSGGTLEILLEPAVPLPVVAVYGHAPIATALVRADRLFGLQVRAVTDPQAPLPAGTTAVVVASHGSDEVPILSAALRAGVPYVGLVASRRRGPAVVGALEVDDALRTSVHTPAGLDIGARSAPEVALSILAEIVSARHARHARDKLRGDQAAFPRSEHPASSSPALSRDPVCGMPVAAAAASPHVETPAGRVWFCGTGCRTAYVDNPAAYPS